MTDPDACSPPSRTAALALSMALLGGCGTRAGSDQPATPLASVCGGGTHISSQLGGFYGPAPWVQPPNVNSLNCPYPPNENVYSTCLTVTAVDRWDETGNGAVGTVYLQDTVSPTPVYAGTSLFGPSFSPPDLRVLPGDVLDVTGIYEEFIGPSTGVFQQCETLPQIAGAASFRYDGEVPAPVEIQPVDLTTYDSARKYLNMLVSVKNVVVAADGASTSGRYNAPVVVPSGSNHIPWTIADELFDVGSQYPLHTNDTFDSVTGVVTYFYKFQLAPRSAADFHKKGAAPADGG